MGTTVTRIQVVNFLRAQKFKYERKARHVEVHKLPGTMRRAFLAGRDIWPEDLVRITLTQAGFSRDAVEQFLREATKEPAQKLC
jgi:hypothetical protein